MTVSFDFDGVLDNHKAIKLAKLLLKEGNDVWIVTRRLSTWNNTKVYDLAQSIGISGKVIFTEGNFKVGFLKDFDMHIDDDDIELELINALPNCIGLKFKDE